MKKMTRFAVVAMIAASLLYVGCSSDETVGQTTSTPQASILSQMAAKTTSSAEANFLKSTYNTVYKYGKSVDTKDENGVKLTVTEVILDGDSAARGYVVNRASDNAFLYFADFDRKANTMKATNIITNEVDLEENVDDNVFYNEVGGDIIKLIEHVNDETQYTTNSWFAWISWTFTMDHFWGTEVTGISGPYYDENLNCYKIQTSVKRVFWIAWSGPRTQTIGCK